MLESILAQYYWYSDPDDQVWFFVLSFEIFEPCPASNSDFFFIKVVLTEVLANIPPAVRREAALAKEWFKIEKNESLPIHHDLIPTPTVPRLKSRNPILTEPFFRSEQNYSFDIKDKWRAICQLENLRKKHLENDLTERVNGMGMDDIRRIWCRLNRIRTGHERCANMLYKWNASRSPNCDCGDVVQITNHIVIDCPKRKFADGLSVLHELPSDAVHWLHQLDIDL